MRLAPHSSNVRSQNMTMNDKRALLSGSLVWVALYFATSYSVHWLLSHDLPVLYSAIPSSLEYFVPGFLVAYLAKRKALFLGFVIGLGGSVVWLLHTGFYADLGRLGLYVTLSVFGNVLLAVTGAYVAGRWFSARHSQA